MNTESKLVDSPESEAMDRLCEQLREQSKRQTGQLHSADGWPAEQLEQVAAAGVYRWFVPRNLGGLGWSGPEIVEGYVRLASACLTTTFVLTQQVAAIKRICSSENATLRDRLLPGLISGREPATVGISHLTTSRRHVANPVLKAEVTANGFAINGFSPWVTGGSGAKFLVMGAEQLDGQQVLFVVAKDAAGITVEPGFELVALSGSQTGPVRCREVMIDEQAVLAGPMEHVLSSAGTASTGSFQTSALAVGLAQSAIDFIREESVQRPDLNINLDALESQHAAIKDRLMQLAAGVPVCSNEDLRAEANSLVLRATQSAMVAAKGAGFVQGHPVGRWCQEALFFLVWSCPQAVLNANLCELAGIEG